MGKAIHCFCVNAFKCVIQRGSMQDILTRLHERYGREIDEALLKYLSIDASPEFLDAVKYQVATGGGKRIRPPHDHGGGQGVRGGIPSRRSPTPP